MGKKLFMLFAGAALALLLLAADARAEDFSLKSGVFFAPASDMEESLLEGLYMQGEVIERTQRRTVVGQSPPPAPPPGYNPRYNPDMPAQWSLRVGWLWVSHAEDEKPTNVPSLGLSVRVLLPPDGLHMLELSFESSVDRMELDTDMWLENFYQEYYDIAVLFLGSFGARTGVETPLYWGVGIGYSKETARGNYTDDARNGLIPADPIQYPGAADYYNESGVLHLKIGWDSGRNTYVELVYRKVFDSDRNLDQMFNLVVGIYF